MTSLETLLPLIEAHPYLLLFPLVLVEGPLATICAGLLVAAGAMSFPPALALVVAADLSGDSLYFLLGRSGRRGKLHRLGLTEARMTKLEGVVAKEGPKALVGAKLFDAAAIPVFVAAGLAGMGFARFLAWSFAATLPKSAALLALGFFFGWHAEKYLGLGMALAVLLVAAFLLAAWKSSKRKTKED